MTTDGLTIRWIGIDAAHDRAALAAVLGVDIPDEGSIEIPGLRLEIDAPGPGRARGRLQAKGPDPRASTMLIAVSGRRGAAHRSDRLGALDRALPCAGVGDRRPRAGRRDLARRALAGRAP
jgi:hypothetical protein